VVDGTLEPRGAPAGSRHRAHCARAGPLSRCSFAAGRPGDRLRCAAGRRPLKKLFGEARIPVRERRTLPVLADAAGAVLWVPGIAVAHGSAPLPGEPAITLSLADAEH
jgi:tRNA(Ile)-lysidine synthase